MARSWLAVVALLAVVLCASGEKNLAFALTCPVAITESDEAAPHRVCFSRNMEAI